MYTRAVACTSNIIFEYKCMNTIYYNQIYWDAFDKVIVKILSFLMFEKI